MMTPRELSLRLRLVREHAGLTQKQLADKSGVNRSSISFYESSPDRARRAILFHVLALLDACGWTPADFFAPAFPVDPDEIQPVDELPSKRHGQERKDYCGAGHLLSATRRFRIYQPRDGGDPRMVSSGCSRCSAMSPAERQAAKMNTRVGPDIIAMELALEALSKR